MIIVGSCGLHTVHNSFKAGASASGWEVCEVLSSLYWLFVDSPARRHDFEKITDSDSHTFPLQFCKYRWLENLPVVIRAHEIWTNVVKYVKKVQSDKKNYTEPTSKSYHVVKAAVNDQLMMAKFAAFESIAKQLQPFLLIF